MKTTRKLTELEEERMALYRRDCDHMARMLLDAFRWVNTPEGEDFWSDVHDRLSYMAEGRTME